MRIFTKYFVFNLGSRVEGWRESSIIFINKIFLQKSLNYLPPPSPSGRCWTPRINIGVVAKIRSMLHAVVELAPRTP